MFDTITAGDALDFDTNVPDYPASDGWVLTYRLVPRVAGAAYTFVASTATDGQQFAIAVSSSTTAGWAAGAYTWSAYVTKAGERHVVDTGRLTILSDPGAVSSLDGRSHARKVLDAIESVLEGTATTDQKRVVIGDREVEKWSPAELIKLRQVYKSEVASEENSARIAAGLAPRNRIYVRR